MRPRVNKYKIKYHFLYYKYRCQYWWYRFKAMAAQIFIPLAIFQLIRTIIFPTPFDVLLLLVMFAVIVLFLLDVL